MQKYLPTWLWMILYSLGAIPAWSQCPQPAFTIPDTVCINEPFDIINNSTDALRYEWDFCISDLSKEPALQNSIQLPGNIMADITTVYDGTNWFGFVCSRDNHSIVRLDFGSNLENNNPDIITINNSGGLLNKPEKIELIKEGADWYALVTNIGNSSLVRLKFGNFLTNVSPVADRITALDGVLNVPRAMTLAKDNDKTVALITNNEVNTITIVNFGSSIANTVTSADIITTKSIPSKYHWGLLGISVIKSCDQWYGIVVNSNNDKVHILFFGNQLFNAPIVTEIQIPVGGFIKVETAYEAGRFYAFLMTIGGFIAKLDFGGNIENNTPAFSTVLPPGIVSNLFPFDLVKSSSNYYLFFLTYDSRFLKRLTFPNSCASNIAFSQNPIPTGVNYNESGLKYFTITAFDATGSNKAIRDSVFVRPRSTIDFSSINQCLSSITEFSGQKQAIDSIISWHWDFGDNTSASGQNVLHEYTSTGFYNVKLTVQDVCGVTLNTTKSVVIYPNSAPNFLAPEVECSNEEILFTDKSIVGDDITQNWNWNFGDGKSSNVQNPTHAFSQSGEYEVTLTITGKSGCSYSISKSIKIKTGAAVDFEVENLCINGEIQFTNKTTTAPNTSLDNIKWDFGDGSSSTETNPIHQFEAPGDYTVILTVENNLNCITTKTKIISIYKLPKAGYSYSLACIGEPISFFDESTASDGNITSWIWDFGDSGSGLADNISNIRNPQHIFKNAGSYKVKLKIQTQYGCTDSTTQTIIVVASPQSNFTFDVDCNTKKVSFSDQSIHSGEDTINSWYWDFGDGNISQDVNPHHTFKEAGNYIVTLITTAKSRCTNSFNKLVTITDKPAADFEVVGNTCVNSPLQFNDKTLLSSSTIETWLWDFGLFGQSTLQHPKITFISEGNITVPVTLTVTTTSGCRASVTKNVVLHQLPQAKFTFQALSPLEPLQINFVNLSSADATEFIWNFGDGKESNDKSPSHTYDQSGTYSVRLIAKNANGCYAEFIQEVIVSSVPSTFEMKLEPISASNSNSGVQIEVRLLNNSTQILKELHFITDIDQKSNFEIMWTGVLNPGQMLIYSYLIPSKNLPNNLPSTICVTTEDKVLKKTSNRQCTSLLDKMVLFDPYPNPAGEVVTLPMFIPAKSKIQILVFDVLGRTIDSFATEEFIEGFHEVKYKSVNLISGIYYFQVSYRSAISVKKVMIQ